MKNYNILQNSSVNSLFAHMPWKDQKSNMNCFYKTFLILLRSSPINRQTEKNMPTLLPICRLINRLLFLIDAHQHWALENSCLWWRTKLCVLCISWLSSFFHQNECWVNRQNLGMFFLKYMFMKMCWQVAVLKAIFM